MIELLQRLVSMVPESKRDEAHLAVGEWLILHGNHQEIWQRMMELSGLPADTPMPAPAPWYRRLSQTFRAQQRRAQKLITFAESIERELTPAPAGETEREARVRVLTDALERCRMFDRAGLKLKTPDGRDDTTNLRHQLERMLTDARIAVRAERGDW